MSNYLSSAELAELVDCQPNSFACMRRWLDRGKWPYETSAVGFPKVSRRYHDARMSGVAPSASATAPARTEPNFAALRAA
jgi:hypothetical protein